MRWFSGTRHRPTTAPIGKPRIDPRRLRWLSARPCETCAGFAEVRAGLVEPSAGLTELRTGLTEPSAGLHEMSGGLNEVRAGLRVSAPPREPLNSATSPRTVPMLFRTISRGPAGPPNMQASLSGYLATLGSDWFRLLITDYRPIGAPALTVPRGPRAGAGIFQTDIHIAPPEKLRDGGERDGWNLIDSASRAP